MAEIGKPIGRGPTIAAPQPASSNRRGAGTGPRRALERRSSGGQAHPEHTEDTLDAEHPPAQERGAAKPDAAAPRGYQAAMARPMASGARPALGGQRLPPRAAGTMPGTGSLNLQANKEHGPPVFAAALSLLNMLTTGPAAAAQGTTAPHQQEALRNMSRLLQQARLQYGFTEADAQRFLGLAEVAGVAHQPKLVAVAAFVRPASPADALRSNPFGSPLVGAEASPTIGGPVAARSTSLNKFDGIMEDREVKVALPVVPPEVVAASVAEQDGIARAKSTSERLEKRLADRAQDLQTATQEARLRARRMARGDLPVGAKSAQDRAFLERERASMRGHTVPQEALSPEDIHPKKSDRS